MSELSHGLQLLMLCCSVGPYHRSVPQDCAAPAQAPQAASFRSHPLPHCGLLHGCMWRCAHGLQGDSLPHHGALLGTRGLLQTWNTSCALSALTFWLQGCFSHSFLSHSSCCVFLYFLKYMPQRCRQLHGLAQLWPGQIGTGTAYKDNP